MPSSMTTDTHYSLLGIQTPKKTEPLKFKLSASCCINLTALQKHKLGAAPFTVRSTPNCENTNGWNRTGSHDCSELFWVHNLGLLHLLF